MRKLSNGIALVGAIAWTLLAAWHAHIVVQYGVPDDLIVRLLMATPGIALGCHALMFAWSRVRQSRWGIALEALSLLFALALVWLEVSMRFIGYK